MNTNIIATVMVRNEENFIVPVVRPLAAVCGRVLVGDTGSTDATVVLARSVPGVEVIEYGAMPYPDLVNVRVDLGQRAHKLGAEWQLLCDGDELYNVSLLRQALQQTMPPQTEIGFTRMVTLDEDDNGDLWEVDDKFNRTALLKADVAWHGKYPFEAPVSFDKRDAFYYLDPPAGYRYQAVHLHRLVRSGRDSDVALRLQKQKQYCLQHVDIPRTVRFDMAAWCAAEEV